MSVPKVRLPHTPTQFVNAKVLIDRLWNNRSKLTQTEMSSLREQALCGDVDGAMQALNTLLRARQK